MSEEEFNPHTLLDTTSTVWMRLPSAPSFMCIMRTKEGKPIGSPIWTTFENKPDEHSLNNETISSTLLNLSNLLTSTVSTNKENFMKISFGGRSWSIYTPSPNQGLQITFIVAFEENDLVKITERDRVVLTKSIVDSLSKIPEFTSFLSDENSRTISPETSLYKTIFNSVSQVIQKWDEERIEYLKEEAERLREELNQEAMKRDSELEEF